MRVLQIAAVSSLFLACAHQGPRETTVKMEPVVFEAKPSGEVTLVDAQAIFERAGAAFGEKELAQSVKLYDELVARFPDSKYVTPALYNCGLALENQRDLAGAAERYRKLIARGAEPNDLLDAEYRLGGVYEALANWPAAVEAWSEVLARKDLTLSDRIEATARKGVAQLNAKDLGASERTLREAIQLWRDHSDEERLDTDYFVGEAAYYVGEIAHAEYRALPVRLPEQQLARDLEAKARMLLTAQSRFIDAMRVNNAEWATASGYQIASLYREFYDDLVGAPIPPGLQGEAREVYQEELKKQVRTLLQKAIAVHEKNVLMAERIGVKNDWVKKSNEQMDELRKLLVPGPTAPAATPPPEPPPKPPTPPIRDEIKPRVVL